MFERKEFYARYVVSSAISIVGLFLMGVSWYALFQIANSAAQTQLTDLPVTQIVYNAGMPAAVGFVLFFLGVCSYFATKGAFPWFGVGTLIWIYGAYNMYIIGVSRPAAPFVDYITQVVIFLFLGIVLYGVAILVSWHGQFKRAHKTMSELDALRKEVKGSREAQGKQKRHPLHRPVHEPAEEPEPEEEVEEAQPEEE